MLSLMEQCLAGMGRIEADTAKGQSDFHAGLADLLDGLDPYAAFRPCTADRARVAADNAPGVAF